MNRPHRPSRLPLFPLIFFFDLSCAIRTAEKLPPEVRLGVECENGQIRTSTMTASRDDKPCAFDALAREERRIAADTPGIELFVMRVRDPARSRRPIMLMHGAGSPSSAIWDVRHEDYSLMGALACRGFDVFAVDVRGFGGSTMIDALKKPAEASPPQVRLHEVVDDLGAAVRFAAKTSSASDVDLIGWSWGAEVAGAYASRHAELVRRLVLMSPVYDRRWPARHQSAHAWYALSRSEMLKNAAPPIDPTAWEDIVNGVFRFAGGDTIRLPNGPYRDIYGEDAPLWDAGKVAAATMIIRGGDDKASLDPHAQNLFRALANAKARRYVVLGGSGHFPFAEAGAHRELAGVIAEFLAEL